MYTSSLYVYVFWLLQLFFFHWNRWLDSSIEYLQNSLSKADHSSQRFSLLSKLAHFDLKSEMVYVRHLITFSQSPVVFAHNDMQEGNILFNKTGGRSRTRISFIDFEYCSYNYRGFDLTNHFCEWMYSYKLQESPYFTHDKTAFPNRQQQVILNYTSNVWNLFKHINNKRPYCRSVIL